MEDKHLRVLHQIFENEFASPLRLVELPTVDDEVDIFNRFGEPIGYVLSSFQFENYPEIENYTEFDMDLCQNLTRKIKNVFGLEILDIDDFQIVLQHLHKWLEENLSLTPITIEVFNDDSRRWFLYPPKT